MFVVVDAIEQRRYNELQGGLLLFSPDSKNIVYGVKETDNWFVVIDGKKVSSYDGIVADPIFSPDGKRYAYVAQLNEKQKQAVIIDGVKAEIKGAVDGSPVFGPDSKHIAYAINEGHSVDAGGGFVLNLTTNWRMVIDGKISKEYDKKGKGIGRPIFDSPTSLHYLALLDENIYLVKAVIK